MKENNPDKLGFQLKNTTAFLVAAKLKAISEIANDFCVECDGRLTITSNWSTFSRLLELLHELTLDLDVCGVKLAGDKFEAYKSVSEVLSEDEYSAFLDFTEIGMKDKFSGMQVIKDDAAMFLLGKLGAIAQIYDLALTQYKKDGRIELSYQQLHDVCRIGSDLDLALEEFGNLSCDVFVEREGPITTF